MSSFAVGDRVEHVGGMGKGIVESVSSNGTVRVKYENWKSVGEYDANWFDLHPDWLRRVGG